jgi:hypothetical protein
LVALAAGGVDDTPWPETINAAAGKSPAATILPAGSRPRPSGNVIGGVPARLVAGAASAASTSSALDAR